MASKIKVNEIDTSTNTDLSVKRNGTEGVSLKTTGAEVATRLHVNNSQSGASLQELVRLQTAGQSDGSGITIDTRTAHSIGQINFLDGTGSFDGNYVFKLGTGSQLATPTEILRITPNGLAIGGTGTANTLDDYEEGTHTVSITGSSSGSATVGDSATKLKYIKIGKEVWVHGEIHITGISSISGEVRVSLPFAVGDTTEVAERSVGNCALKNIDISSGVVQVTPFCFGGSSYFVFLETNDNGGTAEIQGSALSSGDEFIVSLQYTTS